MTPTDVLLLAKQMSFIFIQTATQKVLKHMISLSQIQTDSSYLKMHLCHSTISPQLFKFAWKTTSLPEQGLSLDLTMFARHQISERFVSHLVAHKLHIHEQNCKYYPLFSKLCFWNCMYLLLLGHIFSIFPVFSVLRLLWQYLFTFIFFTPVYF